MEGCWDVSRWGIKWFELIIKITGLTPAIMIGLDLENGSPTIGISVFGLSMWLTLFEPLDESTENQHPNA